MVVRVLLHLLDLHAYALAYGIAHRDYHHGNALITAKGSTSLIDFDQACVIGPQGNTPVRRLGDEHGLPIHAFSLLMSSGLMKRAAKMLVGSLHELRAIGVRAELLPSIDTQAKPNATWERWHVLLENFDLVGQPFLILGEESGLVSVMAYLRGAELTGTDRRRPNEVEALMTWARALDLDPTRLGISDEMKDKVKQTAPSRLTVLVAYGSWGPSSFSELLVRHLPGCCAAVLETEDKTAQSTLEQAGWRFAHVVGYRGTQFMIGWSQGSPLLPGESRGGPRAT